jgi:hypothetical protein
VSKEERRTWYRIALAREGHAPPQLVAASGEHMGQAIAEAQDHVPGSWPIAVDHATAEVIPLGESVGKGHVIDLPPPPDLATASTFRWPVGVLPSLQAVTAFTGARAGWVQHADPTLLVLEAQVASDALTDLFLGLIERLPAADNLEVRVLDHFEDAKTSDVWLTSRVNAKKILRFLDDHDVELLGNGHLELSIYVRAHKATLRLTEHKTVVWLAESNGLKSDVIRWLGELKVPHIDSLVSVRDGAHFHYRPAKSRDRKKLGEELYRQRLRKVDRVDRETVPG